MGQDQPEYRRSVGRCEQAPNADTLVDYWIRAGESLWFAKNSELDADFRDGFSEAYHAAATGRLEHWLDSPVGGLGLTLLLDQYPRNAFRGSPRMYATDALARRYAALAVAAGYDTEFAANLRIFFYLPFAHSEHPADQDFSLELHRRLGYTENARRHRDIIRRFGRFPHRNAILGRETTPEEQRFLDDSGFSG